MLCVDAVEGDIAEDSPLKKKATPAKGKGKKTPTTATKSEDEASPIKQEVADEASGDDA
jgi:hypothetical protein